MKLPSGRWGHGAASTSASSASSGSGPSRTWTLTGPVRQSGQSGEGCVALGRVHCGARGGWRGTAWRACRWGQFLEWTPGWVRWPWRRPVGPSVLRKSERPELRDSDAAEVRRARLVFRIRVRSFTGLYHVSYVCLQIYTNANIFHFPQGFQSLLA